MAKNKNKTEAATPSENGGIVFEVMPEDFALPQKQVAGQWDELLTRLTSDEHKKKFARDDGSQCFVTLYKAPKDAPEGAYTRSKAVRKAAKKLNLDVEVAVRQMPDHVALLARAVTVE